MSQQPTSLAFTLFDIEQSIARRDYIKFEKYLISLLEFIDLHGGVESTLQTNTEGKDEYSHIGLVPFNNKTTFTEKLNLYSRLAATITTYLSDNEHVPNDVLLIHIIILKTHISNIFYLSCYGSMDHILFNRGLLDSDNTLNLKTEQDIKFLYTCFTLNSQIPFQTEQLVNAIPTFGMYWYLGLLYSHHYAYNKRIENNFNKIAEAHSLIQKMTFDSTAVELSTGPWMLCSYQDKKARHEIKRSINVAVAAWVSKIAPPGLNKKISTYIDKTKEIKRVVILSEKLNSKHAMFRCYFTRIAELSAKYNVTLVSAENDYDDAILDAVDNVVTVIDSAENTVDTLKKISSLKPDLIIYPSLGMAKWTIPLANMRLAKYQMMTYGHPASAFSEHIDFGVVTRYPAGYDYQKFCMEKVTPFHDEYNYSHPHPELENVVPQKILDNVVRIAINSSLLKITRNFIDLCGIIQTNSSVPVEFHFFMINKHGESLTAFEKSLRNESLINFVIHPAAPYKEYMENLSICDLAIGTFPFGGSNTNIDLTLLGIPKIFYSDQSDFASFTDLNNLSKLNLPELLEAKSEADVLANAIYLIHDDKERAKLSEYILNQKPYELFFNQKVNHEEHFFIKAINWVMENEKTKPAVS